MASFTVRVELHGSSDYVALHEKMGEKGFSRFITSNSGTRYHLPTAEYDISGDYDRSIVLDLAVDAVSEAGKTGEVLVTESNGRTWKNLRAS